MPPDNPRARRLTLTSLAAVTAALPNGNSSSEPLPTALRKPMGYPAAHPFFRSFPFVSVRFRTHPFLLCRAVRNTHTPAAIKLPSITPAVSLRPSHTPLRQANPRGIPRHTHFSVRFRSFPYPSVSIVPRPRNTHTPAAIKKIQKRLWVHAHTRLLTRLRVEQLFLQKKRIFCSK